MNAKNNMDRKRIEEWIESSQHAEIQQTEEALIQYAIAHSTTPPQPNKGRILERLKQETQPPSHIGNKENNRFPLLGPYSKMEDWIQLLGDHPDPQAFEGIHMEPLYKDSRIELNLVWVKDMVPEEVHQDVMESFLLLEGSCSCTIEQKDGNTRTVHMKPGDFLALELGERHDIRVTSPYPAKAILQWLSIAA